MKYIKSKYRYNLSDERSQLTMLIVTIRFNANYKEILKNNQFQTSHSLGNKLQYFLIVKLQLHKTIKKVII